MTADEEFNVTIRVAVEGAEGGWNPKPILDCIRGPLFGDGSVTGRGVLSIDIRRVRPPTPTVDRPPSAAALQRHPTDPRLDWTDDN